MHQTPPKISVIVPCYNAAAFVPRTIESVRSQSTIAWELILVDDGSSDDTPSIISRYAGKDHRIRGLSQRNSGKPSACNLGVSQVNPESSYIFFLDHDDELETIALESMSSYLDLHQEVGLLGCQFASIDPEGGGLPGSGRSRWVPGRFLPRKLKDTDLETPFVTFFCATGQGPFAMFRKSTFLQTNGFDVNIFPHEDTDIFCQMALKGKVHFLPDRLYRKRIHSAAVTRQTGPNDRIQAGYTAFRRKWDSIKPTDPREAQTLQQARAFYYGTFRPCRHLKVAAKALIEGLTSRDLSSVKWSFSLCHEAFSDYAAYHFRTSRT